VVFLVNIAASSKQKFKRRNDTQVVNFTIKLWATMRTAYKNCTALLISARAAHIFSERSGVIEMCLQLATCDWLCGIGTRKEARDTGLATRVWRAFLSQIRKQRYWRKELQWNDVLQSALLVQTGKSSLLLFIHAINTMAVFSGFHDAVIDAICSLHSSGTG
jgi:hypothetical protein